MVNPRVVLEMLSGGPLDAHDIARKLGGLTTSSDVDEVLTPLEDEGLIATELGDRWAITDAGRSRLEQPA